MKTIESARLIRYNANSAGHNTGDCVKRALSLAFDMDYNDLSKLLRAESKKTGFPWNSPLVYRGIARSLGAEKFISVPIKDQQTVDSFIDSVCPEGTWLLETGKSPESASTHICCVIDGVLYDSWESQDYYVDAYSHVNISERKPFTDISDHMDDLAQQFGQYVMEETQKCINRYEAKGFDWAKDVTFNLTSCKPNAYQATCKVKVEIGPTSYHKSKSFTLTYIAVLHPTDSVEDAEDILKKTAKTRVYDRMWTVNDLEKKAYETWKAEQDQGGQVQLEVYGDYKRGMALYRSMPAWARAACSEIYITSPGKYSNSYQVLLQEPGTGRTLEFESYTADELRKELQLYKDEGLLPGYDYSVYEIDTM